MAQVRILLMPVEMRREMVIVVGDRHAELVKTNLDKFLMLPPMEAGLSSYPRGGQDFAEEMFDLTNNPGREEERTERYGNGRSLSSGDVVRTETGDFLCCSFGWQKL